MTRVSRNYWIAWAYPSFPNVSMSWGGTGQGRCQVRDTCVNSDCLERDRAFLITPQEVVICEAHLNRAAVERGLDYFLGQ